MRTCGTCEAKHIKDVDHHMYGTWKNLRGLQRARPWEPAFAPRHECRQQYEIHTLHNRDEDHLVEL